MTVITIATDTVYNCSGSSVSSSDNKTKHLASCASERLSRDMSNLYHFCTLSDVQLQARGEQCFRAHKAILATRSPVFAAMFSHGMKETQSGLVDLSDVEPAVLDELLHFVYSGSLLTDIGQFSEPKQVQESKGPRGPPKEPCILGAFAPASARTEEVKAPSAIATSAAGWKWPWSKSTHQQSQASSFLSLDDSSAIPIACGATLIAADTKRPRDSTASRQKDQQITSHVQLMSHLLLQADRFQIADLVQLCVDVLSQHLCLSNILDILQLADRFPTLALKVIL